MTPTEVLPDVARAIQLALTPVFLLTGIAGMLNVMTGRLSRIIDRGRALGEDRPGVVSSDLTHAELLSLDTRRHLTSVAIASCTIAALLLCVDIVALFVEVMLGLPLNWLVGLLFVASTLALVVGLSFFLREVHMVTRTVRIPTAGR